MRERQRGIDRNDARLTPLNEIQDLDVAYLLAVDRMKSDEPAQCLDGDLRSDRPATNYGSAGEESDPLLFGRAQRGSDARGQQA